MQNLLEKYKNIALPAKASVWFIICSLIQKGIAFFTTPFFTRLMSPSCYGIVVIYNSWMEIITVFATFQLATGVFNKAMIKYENDRDGYTSSCLFLTSCITLLTLVLYLICPTIWNKVLDLPTSMVVMMFMEIFATSAMSFWSIRNRFEYKYKSVVICTLIVAFVGPILSILMLLNAPPENQAQVKICGMLIVKIVVYSILYFLIMKNGKKVIKLNYWKYSVIFNLPLIPHYLSQQVLTQSDRIMINKICGASDAGIYGVSYQLSMAIFLITLAIHNSFTPWTFECLRDKKYKELGSAAIKIEVLIGIICFGFSLFAPEFINILGGEQYNSAIWIVPPVAMSVLFQTLYTYFGNVEFYYEKTKFVMIASIFCAIANIMLNAVFIPLFGFIAAGYTTLVCYVLYSLVHWLFMTKICNDKNIPEIYTKKYVWLIGFVFIILSLSVSILYKFTIIRYSIIIIMLGFTVFIITKYKDIIIKLIRK